ncbi:hypothetical protein A6V39_00040 [Candidatus Mycoplasma haematobovis]|uniref:Uncharacterized protein n=1 Tax=Candidatus Mycoplasma haematobovis TaxID=432608 RepID=A0A1A9QDW0_9MOLU|nr:hypothetical protein [Candidatus Mycoplasma haematobovis]OAL10438.1 hypothetical protein A6V39_00040 [Candidatus Mycoplasma haematobovis]
MSLKQVAIIAVTATLISGGAAIGTYFLAPPAKTKPKGIREALIEKGVKFLNVDTNSNEHDEIWESLILLFLAPNKDRLTKITAPTIKNRLNKDANLVAIKEACTNLLNEKEVDDTRIKMAEDWCALEVNLLASPLRT